MEVSELYVYELKEDFDFSRQWIPILKTGFIPSKNTEISSEDLDEVIKSFKEKARGENIEIPVVSTHNGTEADGWIKDLKRENNTVYALIEWNDKGLEKIKNKVYRYVSPEIIYGFKDKHGRIHKVVLFRLALTNIPALDIEPLDKIVMDDEGELKTLGLIKKFAYSEEEKETLHKDMEKRSKKYKIPILPDGHLTPPSKYVSEGATDEEDYADPVNWKYPIANEELARAALNYFSKPDNYQRYPEEARDIIWLRIIKACLKFGINVKYNPNLHSNLPENIKKKLLNYEGGQNMDEEKLEKTLLELEEKIKEKDAKILELESKLKEYEREKLDLEWFNKVKILIEKKNIPPYIEEDLLKLDLEYREPIYNILSKIKMVNLSGGNEEVISSANVDDITKDIEEAKKLLRERKGGK